MEPQGGYGMDGKQEPVCELAQWAITEIAKRRRSGESVTVLASGVDTDQQALLMAQAGARVLLLSDGPELGHVDIYQLPSAGLADPEADLPLEPFDIILCQRCLNSLDYEQARRAIRRLMLRLKIGGKLFISLYGIHSELGDNYADGGKLVNERFCPVPEAMARRYRLNGPVCLYSERNLFSLLMEAGCAVIKTSTSALGHVRGIAARV